MAKLRKNSIIILFGDVMQQGGIYRVCRWMVLVCWIGSVTERGLWGQTQEADSLKKLLLNPSLHDTIRVQYLYDIARATRHTNYDSCLIYAKRSKVLSEHIGNIKWIAFSLRLIGTALSNKGLYQESLDTTLRALALIKTIGDKESEATILNNIGFMLKSSEQYVASLEYFERAKALSLSLKDKRGVALALGNVADVYFRQQNYHEALKYALSAISYARQITDNYVLGVSLFHTGDIYEKLKQYDSAEYFQESALYLFRENNMMKYIGKSLNSLARSAFAQGKYKQAIRFGVEGLDVTDSIRSYEEAAKLSQTIAEAYASLGQYQQSLGYFKTYIAWKDSLNGITIQQKLEQFKSNQEVIRKQERITLLEKDQANQALVRNSLLGGLGLVCIIVVVLVRNNAQRKKANDLLNQQATQIQLKNIELHESLETLRRTQTQLVQAEKMASLGTLVAGVAHELNTPIGVAVTAASTLEVRTREFVKRYTEGGLKKSELEQYVQTAQTGADLTLRNLERAANLIQSFKQVAVDQTRDEIRVFKVRAYLQEIVTSLQPMLKTSTHRIEIECAEEIEMESYPGALAQIITNFVQNSIKHGFEGYREDGLMTITVSVPTTQAPSNQAPNNQVTILYTDNGRGIPAEVLPCIFDPFFTTMPGEQGGTGLGLHIVYNLVAQKLGGEMTCSSEFGKGVTFQIILRIV